MSLFNILKYLNLISLTVFFGLIIFIGYQIYFLKKEEKKNSDNIVIPDFDEKNFQGIKNYTSLNESLNKDKLIKKENNFYIFVLIGLSILALLLFFLINSKLKSLEEDKLTRIQTQPTININKNQLNEDIIPSTTIYLSPTLTINLTSPTLTINPFLSTTVVNSPLANSTNEIFNISITPTKSETIIASISLTQQLIQSSPTITQIINKLPLTADLRSIFLFIGSLSFILLAFLF